MEQKQSTMPNRTRTIRPASLLVSMPHYLGYRHQTTPRNSWKEELSGNPKDRQRVLSRPKNVEPNRRKKVRSAILNPMLRFESHLIPLPTPDRAERVEAHIMIMIATSTPVVLAVPASFVRPPIPMRVRPATNCSTPNPSVCATPRYSGNNRNYIDYMSC